MTTTEVKEKPILFSGPMVRAILEGRKTQTRRIIKHPPYEPTDEGLGVHLFTHNIQSPYGNTGGRLWVRETHRFVDVTEKGEGYLNKYSKIFYRATDHVDGDKTWKPSIFMPRWASRITLEIVRVRVERLQNISEDDACAEGMYTNEQAIEKLGLPKDTKIQGSCIDKFRIVWDSINGKTYPWSSNPWVWVVEFKKAEVNENQHQVLF